MIFILLFVFCGVAAVTFNRKIEQTIPMGVGLIMLSGYLSAITNHLSRTVLLSSFLLVMACILCFGIYCIKYYNTIIRSDRDVCNNSVAYADSDTNEASAKLKALYCMRSAASDFIINVAHSYLSISLWIFLALAGIVVFSTSHHFVTNWDDFNYWANFPKNIYYSDMMLSGGSLATAFKDYLPIVQLLYYTVFKSVGYFKESLMFATNNILIYVYMIPLMFAVGSDRVVNAKNNVVTNKLDYLLERFLRYPSLPCVMVGILFIPAFSFQSYHCLGVDIIISVMFGYGLVRLLFEKRDLFFYADMLIYLSVLIMVKSASIMIAATIVIALLYGDYKNMKNIMKDITIVAPAFVLFASWKYFCISHGNVSYLTERMDSSISDKSFLMLPDYTIQVVVKFFKELAFYSLNDGKLGMSALMCSVFTVVVIVVYIKKLSLYNKQAATGIKRIFAIINIGAVIYVVFLLYTYLFVFEKWEALSLSSFDRYISLYILGPMYLACYILVCENVKTNLNRSLPYFLTILMFVTLNFSFLINTMGSNNYPIHYQKIIDRRVEVSEELSKTENIWYGKRLLIINCEQDDELEKYQQYEALPSVTYIMRVGDEDSSALREKILEQMEDHHIDYALFYDTGEIISNLN